MTTITIPPEAVEAAARAAMDDAGWHWDTADEARRNIWRRTATAAIRAALGTWPGVDYRPGAKVTKTWRDPGKIILPLTENPDAEA